MKKVLFTAVFALLFATLSFASNGIVKSSVKQPIKTEKVTKVVRGEDLKPGDIEKMKKQDWGCVLIVWEDGSWLLVCCEAPCTIIVEFEN